MNLVYGVELVFINEFWRFVWAFDGVGEGSEFSRGVGKELLV